MPPTNRVYVVEINEIIEHPNADRLEILQLCRPDPAVGAWCIEVVTGKHYKVDQLGVYIPPGCLLPGWLAEDLWMVGSGNANRWHLVEPKIMRGVPSAGLFAGECYKKVREDPRSVRRYGKLEEQGGAVSTGDWIRWPIWQTRWKPGDDVGDYLGVQCPDSSTVERPVVNREAGVGEQPDGSGSPGFDSPSGLSLPPAKMAEIRALQAGQLREYALSHDMSPVWSMLPSPLD